MISFGGLFKSRLDHCRKIRAPVFERAFKSGAGRHAASRMAKIYSKASMVFRPERVFGDYGLTHLTLQKLTVPKMVQMPLSTPPRAGPSFVFI
jgi:hypothetical protein